MDPRARGLYQQAHLLSRDELEPSVSWFSWKGEFSLSLLLRFTFATVPGFCLFICLIPHHSSVSIAVDLTYLVPRKRRIKIWSTGITAVRSNTCGPSASHAIYLPYQQPEQQMQFCRFFCTGFLSWSHSHLQSFPIPRLEELGCSPVPSPSLWGSRTESCCPSEKPLAASGDGCKLNKD